jgi:CDP-glucose 4,6-dehydratase
LSGYLLLAAHLDQDSKNHGEAYNFGPSADQNHPVSELIDEMSKYWDMVKWNDVSESDNQLHEAGLLKLNCDKALFDLDWHSTLQFEETVKMTIQWYKYFYQNPGQPMYDFTISQIDKYTGLASSRCVAWANND